MNYVRRYALFLVALIFFLPFSAQAQIEEVLHKTSSGCSFYLLLPTDQASKAALANLNQVWTWDGDCVEGLAQGPGVLRGKTQWVTSKLTIKFHHGRMFGFGEDAYIFNDGIMPKFASWRFVWGPKLTGFNGLGLQGDANLLNNAAGAMPSRSSVLKPMGALHSGNGGLVLIDMPCMIDTERFPDCGLSDGKQDYQVYFFQSNGAIATKTYCPRPKELTSCASIVGPLLEPFVLAAEAFIRESMPRVLEMELVMNATLTKAGSVRHLAAKAKAEAGKQAAELAARQQAAANAAFEGKLDSAPVGELFAMSDEFMSKGDSARARMVLRKLMGRFPDHKLATLAATMLTELQGK